MKYRGKPKRYTSKSNKQKYSKQPQKPPRWSCWDVLAMELTLCLLIGLAAHFGAEPIRSWLGEVYAQPELILPDTTELELLRESVETFLNQYIYEEKAEETLAMGGYNPVAAYSEEPAEGCTYQKVCTAADLTAPVSGTVTSEFAYREHPITGELDFHTGVDIAAAEGTAIHAAADGVVTEAGWSDSYGNYLVVEHSSGFSTKYAHCSQLIARAGDVIRKGERIGLVGSTGISTGPHLHFETWVDGLKADPLWLLL